MKTLYIKLMLATFFAFTTNVQAQIKNAKTETVTVYGNCGMCEKTIEAAGSLKKLALVDWNKETKLATITFDSKKTNAEEVLKRIALAGYDSDQFLAPDDTYNNLHGCCQYDRVAKVSTANTSADDHNVHKQSITSADQQTDKLKMVFDSYFELKDALVNSNAILSASKASELSTAINNVAMDKLNMDVHMVWMKVVDKIKAETKSIAATKDLVAQRKQFTILSAEMASLIKVSKFDVPVYVQFCPMANDGKGANWLSKDSAIKNPYYGASMMSCGKTVETIK